jgi:hypothetical protein
MGVEYACQLPSSHDISLHYPGSLALELRYMFATSLTAYIID